MLFGQAYGGVAEHSLNAFRRSQIASRSIGDLHIALGRLQTLLAIGVEQRDRCHATHDSCQLPSQVVSVCNARVATTGTKGADDFGRVTNEEHTALAKLVQAL